MPDIQLNGAAPLPRQVVDALPRAIIVTDGDGRIVIWNRKAEALYGWAEGEVLGKTTLEVLLPVEPDDDSSEMFDRVRRGEPYVGDRTVTHRDGRPLRVFVVTEAVLDDAGKPMWVVGASEDVADVRRAEQQMQDLSDRLRLALDAAGLGTWRWDTNTGEVSWDERMEALFGFEPGGFDGTFDAYQAALHPEDRGQVLAAVKQAVETRSRYAVEHRVRLADGSDRWIHGAGMVTVDPEGTVNGAIGCSMDITDRIRARLAAEDAARSAAAAADAERVTRERFEFLSAINGALADAENRAEIMTAVTRAAVPHLGDWCSIYVLTPGGGPRPEVETFHIDPDMVDYARGLTERFPYDPQAPTGMAAVIRTGQPEFYPNITAEIIDDALDRFGDDDADELRKVLARLALRSAISVPLIKRGRVVGGLSFANTTARRTFTDDDLALAEVVAGRVASSLENRRLSEEQREIASTLQAGLLPQQLPDISGIDVAMRYWAAGEASEVGGDFYDLFEIGDRAWAAVIGDVCGTGPAAAAVTALARHSIRQAAWHGDDAVTILQWLNHAMRDAYPSEASFLTTTFVRITPTSAGFDFEVTNAGHPPPVVVRADGSGEMAGEYGGLVGVFDKVTARPVTVHAAAGDTLVLYTDGLTDVPPPHLLDGQQTLDLMVSCCGGRAGATTVADRLESGIAERLRLHDRPDDIALLVLHVSDTGPR